MKKCQCPLWTFSAVCLAMVMIIGSAFAAGDYTSTAGPGDAPRPAPVVAVRDVQVNPDYSGNLKIYVTEKTSRWATYSGAKYNYGFLDFAYDDDINLAYQESFADTILWDGSSWTGPVLEATNLRVMAVVFNADGTVNYSDEETPHTNPYMAYPVDATAAADLTEIWPNETSYPGFTHTVFVEEGTRTT